MQFFGVGNTNEPTPRSAWFGDGQSTTPYGDHLRSEANLPPLARQQMSQMVREYWDAVYAGVEAALEAETRQQFEQGLL